MHKRWFSKIRWLSILLVFLLAMGVTGCGDRANFPSFSSSRPVAQSQPIKIKEVAPPELIRDLRRDLDAYQPQVQILSPRSDEVLQTQTATVRFSVQDLPLFKDEDLGLGPHLHVFVDDQPYQALYDATAPLVLEGLTPGTHTVRAFASRPWHESFKNEGAFAQTTFHVFAKTSEKAPNPEAPLLTYSRPQGAYGAEPIMLDFYLTQAPLHAIAQADDEDSILDWTIRCTVNGESFEVDEWRPIYLKGFKPGQNWVQLELLDETGAAIANIFNDTVRIIDYTPNGEDALSRLIRNEIPMDDARRIVIAGYEPPAPEEMIPVVEEPVEESLDAADESATELESAPVVTPVLTPDLPESMDAQDAVDEPSPEDLPVEILVPDVDPETESALEQQMDAIQEQVAPVDVDAAAVDGESQGETALSPTDTAQVDDIPEAFETAEPFEVAEVDSPIADSFEVEPSLAVSEPLALTPDESTQPLDSQVRDQEIDAADETLSAAPALSRAIAAPEEETRTPVQSVAPSKRDISVEKDEPLVKTPVAEVRPSPVLNSYEAKAILDELNELETRVEDLKGTIASATDQPASRDTVSPQIEDLRSQLDQLKDKFGDTWQRLSDFVRIKLQG